MTHKEEEWDEERRDAEREARQAPRKKATAKQLDVQQLRGKGEAAATTHVCPGSRLLFGKLLRKVGESLRQFGIMSQSAGTRPRKLRQLSQQHAKAQDVFFRRGSSRKTSRTLC